VTKRASDKWVRRTGFLLGMAIVGALLAGTRMPPPPPGLGLDLTVAPAPSSRLTLKPAGPLLTASGMRAGSEHSGHITVVNKTARPQDVRVVALPQNRALDGTLMVELTLGDTSVYRGPLGGLRRGSSAARVESGDGPELGMRVWLPEGARGYEGRIEDLNLAFDTTRAK
jgi:hypothetical protein